MRRLKVGIDVGGTFTHAVAVEVSSRELVGKACVPTTHTAREGVARGVIDSLQKLLSEARIESEEIVLIAHSTTQATNALLEGDVASVGVIGLGAGLEGWRARSETRFDRLELAPGKFLPVYQRFVDTAKSELSEALARQLIQALISDGAQVIVASEAFGVDHPEREELIVKVAQEMGHLATAASQISKLYGLRVRTRTAVINASMMPKMLETANLTESAIRDSGITTPVMVMRSDGGIMSIDEMRRRPILTMLSGPAAGVAAALMYAQVSDGIFIEVGGTSSDITVIRNGRPQIKSAQIGGHRLYVQTLDVRTLGIAGGSIPRFNHKQLIDVGPRSAHIAQLAYPAFSAESDFSQAKIEFIQPKPGDPQDYLKLQRGEQGYTLTPTEAAWLLDLVKVAGHGGAELKSVNSAFERVAGELGSSPQQLARQILEKASDKIKPTIQRLLREYKLDSDLIRFVGGGGGAMAIVPFAAQHQGFEHTIVEHTEVISAIGAALGLIRDSIERTLINPSNEDLIALRQQAYDAVLAMGAAAETIEVTVEVDNRNKKVVAIATGASELRSSEAGQEATEAERLQLAAQSLKAEASQIRLLGRSEHLEVYGIQGQKSLFLGLIKQPQLKVRVLDSRGTVRLQLNDCQAEACQVRDLRKLLPQVIERLTSFGDAGGLMPELYLLLGRRIIDLSGVLDLSQMQALLEQETRHAQAEAPAVILAQAKT